MRENESLAVAMRPIGEIRPYPGNPRRITEAAVQKVAASIREFGWRSPIVVDPDGVILAGHTRHQAALKLGLKKVPVHVAKDLTPEQAKAYRLADNRTAEEAEWDFPALAIELKDLQLASFDLNLTAFTDADLAIAFADPVAPIAPNDPATEWRGMPGYENRDIRSFRQIIVHFVNQADLDAFAAKLELVIPPKFNSIWYPAQAWDKQSDKRYAAPTSEASS